MTNIRLKGGKEIDLLAIEPKSRLKFHVESRVTTSPSFRLRLKDTYTSKGKPHRRGIDFFAKEKFNHPTITKAVQGIFGDADYIKILVVWDVENKLAVKQAEQYFDIYIILMDSILDVLKDRKKVRGYRDDILRTVELMTFWEKEYSRKGQRFVHFISDKDEWTIYGDSMYDTSLTPDEIEKLEEKRKEYLKGKKKPDQMKEKFERRFKIKRLTEMLLENRIQLTIKGDRKKT